MDDQTPDAVSHAAPCVLDLRALSRVLDLGDDGLRSELCAQLIDDFRRIRALINQDDVHVTARAAHEMKGLAATVGGERLAQMANTVSTSGAELPPAALTVIVASLTAEIDGALVVLRRVQQETDQG